MLGFILAVVFFGVMIIGCSLAGHEACKPDPVDIINLTEQGKGDKIACA